MNETRIHTDGIIQVPGNAVVIACIDPRVHRYLSPLIEAHYGINDFYHITRAGGAGRLASLDAGRGSQGFFHDLRLALGATKKIIATNHGNKCLAYEHAGFHQTGDEEDRLHIDELRIAGNVLQTRFPGVEISLAYLKFAGTPTLTKLSA